MGWGAVLNSAQVSPGLRDIPLSLQWMPLLCCHHCTALPRPIYEESISPFASRVSQRMTHWWGLISPKCAKGGGPREEREERGDSQSKRRGEDKCNGLAIKRKVDGMHREAQSMSKQVARYKSAICAPSTIRSRRRSSIPNPIRNNRGCRRSLAGEV